MQAGNSAAPAPAAAAAAGPTAAPNTTGPKAPTLQAMNSNGLRVPVTLVQPHMPELAAIEPGTSAAIAVQLVMLPGCAADVTAETPHVRVVELRQGVTVRRVRAGSSDLSDRFALAGLALKGSQPCKQGWWMRGVRVLGPMYIQLLCSPELPPELEEAKQSKQFKQVQQQQQQQPASEKGNSSQLTGIAARAARTAAALSAAAVPAGAAAAGPAAASAAANGAQCSRTGKQTPAAAAAAGRGSVAGGCASTHTAAMEASTEGPYISTIGCMSNGVFLPVALVQPHMPEIAGMKAGSNCSVKLQLVLLPPHAADITPDLPAQQVINLHSGISVRKRSSGSMYSLSGLPLWRSKPRLEGWWLRGVRRLGPAHVQLLCSPELPPELAEAKQSIASSSSQQVARGRPRQQPICSRQQDSAVQPVRGQQQQQQDGPTSDNQVDGVWGDADNASDGAESESDEGWAGPVSGSECKTDEASDDADFDLDGSDSDQQQQRDSAEGTLDCEASSEYEASAAEEEEEENEKGQQSDDDHDVPAAVAAACSRHGQPPAAAAAAAAQGAAGRHAAAGNAAAPRGEPGSELYRLTSGPSTTVLINLATTRWVPRRFVSMHMSELAAAPPSTSTPITLQLVLLPPFASDVTTDTPAQRVIELTQGVTMRKIGGKSSGKGGDYYMLSGLPWTSSEPVRNGWFARCVRVLGPLQLQLCCSPQLPPELAEARKSKYVSAQETRRQTRELKMAEERAKWASKLSSDKQQRQQRSQPAGALAAAAGAGASQQQHLQQRSLASPAASRAAVNLSPPSTAAAAGVLRQQQQQQRLSQQQQELFSQQRQQQFSKQQQEQQQRHSHSSQLQSLKRPSAGDETAGQLLDRKRSRHDVYESAATAAAAAAGSKLQQEPYSASGGIKRSGSSLGGVAATAGDRQRHKQDSSAAAAAAAGDRYAAVDGSRSAAWRPAPGHDMPADCHRLNSTRSSSSWHDRQLQPLEQQQHQVPVTYRERAILAKQLQKQLAAITRKHNSNITGCKFWSGTPGSCRDDKSCRYAALHILGQPTEHYTARAGAFQAAGATCDATGNYTSASAGQAGADARRHHQQLQHQHQQQHQQQQQQLTAHESTSLDHLYAQLKAADRAHKSSDVCKHWSGIPGSCRRNSSCSFAASHILGQPTAHYKARAAAFQSVGAVCDATGTSIWGSVGQAGVGSSSCWQQQQQQRSPRGHDQSAALSWEQWEQLHGQQQQQQEQSDSRWHHRDRSRSPIGRQQQQQQHMGAEYNQQQLSQLDQQQQQIQSERLLERFLDDLNGDLTDVDRHWRLRRDSGCKYWSGVLGSCRYSDTCRDAYSHWRDKSTRWYLERADVFRRYNVPCDANGCFHPKWLRPCDLLQRQQQTDRRLLQQQEPEWLQQQPQWSEEQQIDSRQRHPERQQQRIPAAQDSKLQQEWQQQPEAQLLQQHDWQAADAEGLPTAPQQQEQLANTEYSAAVAAAAAAALQRPGISEVTADGMQDDGTTGAEVGDAAAAAAAEDMELDSSSAGRAAASAATAAAAAGDTWLPEQAAAAGAGAGAAGVSSATTPPVLCVPISSCGRGLELSAAAWCAWLPQVTLRAVTKLALRFMLLQQQQQGVVLLPADGPVLVRASRGADGTIRLRSQSLLSVLQQLDGSSITAMAAAADGSGSHTITLTAVKSASTAAAAAAVTPAAGPAAAGALPGGAPTVKQEQQQQPDVCQLPAYAAAALAAATTGAAPPPVHVKLEQQQEAVSSLGAAPPPPAAAVAASNPSPFAAAAAAAASAATERASGQDQHQTAGHMFLPGAAATAAALGRYGSVGSAALVLPQVGSSSHTAGTAAAAAAAAAAAESAEEGPQGTTNSAAAAPGSFATSGALQDNSQPNTASASVSGGAAGASSVLASMPVSVLLGQLGFPSLSRLFEDEMVTTVSVLALMTRQDYADMKVPKGAALTIMEACRQLKGKQ